MKSNYLPSLDGLRAVSIALVVASHALMAHSVGQGALQSAFDGSLGVRVFFVISGFLITTLILREEASRGAVSLKNFYVRRFLRLAPVQLALVLTLIGLAAMTPLHYTACQAISALTYTKNYICTASHDAHLWSLAVEEQFYLFWPLALVRLPRRWAVGCALFMIAVSPVSRVIQYRQGGVLFPWLTSNSDVLMIGCLLALGLDRWPQRAAALTAVQPGLVRLAALLAIAAVQALKANFLLGVFTVTLGAFVQGLAVAVLIASLVLQKGPGFGVLNWSPVRYLGRISYSLYVWHPLFFIPAADFGLAWAAPLTFPFDILAGLGAAMVSHHFLERPFLRLRQRFRGEPALPPADHSVAAAASPRNAVEPETSA